MEENRPEDILKVTLDRLEQEGLWFTTKEDKIYANATNLYSLNEYGDLDDKSKERLIKEVLGYMGDGASFLIEAVNQWIDDNLIEGIIGYVDTLAMKFEVKEAVEETNSYKELGVDDLETTVAEEADEPEKEKKTESKKLQEGSNEDIISKLNQLCKEFNPYGDKEKSNKVKNEVRDILQNAPDGTEMYRVGKETSSGWTSYGSYSNERTVLKKYEKQNGVWKMNGSTKSDINDAVLGILYNSGEFKTLEDAKAEAEVKKQDDRTSHRDIVNIDSEHGVSTNRVDYPNRKTESRATFYKGEDEKSVLHGAKLEKGVAYKVYGWKVTPNGETYREQVNQRIVIPEDCECNPMDYILDNYAGDEITSIDKINVEYAGTKKYNLEAGQTYTIYGNKSDEFFQNSTPVAQTMTIPDGTNYFDIWDYIANNFDGDEVTSIQKGSPKDDNFDDDAEFGEETSSEEISYLQGRILDYERKGIGTKKQYEKDLERLHQLQGLDEGKDIKTEDLEWQSLPFPFIDFVDIILEDIYDIEELNELNARDIVSDWIADESGESDEEYIDELRNDAETWDYVGYVKEQINKKRKELENNLDESKSIKFEEDSSLEELNTTIITPKQFRDIMSNQEYIRVVSWGEIKKFVICQLNEDNFDMSTEEGKAFKKQLQDEGKYNCWTSLFVGDNEEKPYSISGLPIYGSSSQFITKWFKRTKSDVVDEAIKENRHTGILKRVLKENANKVTEIEESKKITEKYHVMAYKRYEDGEIHEEEIDEFDEKDLAEKYKKDFEQDFKDEGYMSLSVVSDLEMDDEDNSNEEYDEDYFEVTDGDRVIQISKEDGKWIDSDGNRYMGYLTPNDIMHYFKGFHIVNESKELKTEASEDYSKPIKVNGKLFRYNYNQGELEYITSDGEVLDSVGLSKENWENKEERDTYIQNWLSDLETEESIMSKEIEDEFGYLFPKKLKDISENIDFLHYAYNGPNEYRYMFTNRNSMEQAKEILSQYADVTEADPNDFKEYEDETDLKKVKGCLVAKFKDNVLNESLKKTLNEGVRQRLNERNEQSAGIIEQALAGITSETSDKESGIITKTSELFNSLSDRGYDVQVSFDNGESTSSISIGQQGANILITITDPEQPLRAFASGNFEINDDSIKMIKSIMEVLK